MILLVIVGVAVFVEGMLLLKLKYDVSSFTRYWEKQNNTSQGEVKYIALGDSAAQGIGASQPQKGYVGLLAQKLNVKPINLSVSGAKISDVTATQIPKLMSYNVTDATIVTLAVGSNDMLDFEKQKFESELDELFGKLPKQTIVGDVPYFGGGRHRGLEPQVEAANLVVNRLAKKHGLAQAQLHKITKQRNSLLVYSADFFHPSNKGYKNWYEAFAQALGL